MNDTTLTPEQVKELRGVVVAAVNWWLSEAFDMKAADALALAIGELHSSTVHRLGATVSVKKLLPKSKKKKPRK